MRELSLEARMILERYESTRRLSAEAKTRLLGGLEARLSAGDLPSFEAVDMPELASPSADFVARAWSAPLTKLSVGLTAVAGVVAPVLATQHNEASEPVAISARSAPSAPLAAPVLPGALDVMDTAPSAAEARSPAPEVSHPEPGLPATRTRTPPLERPGTSRPLSPTETTIDEEIRLLKRAQTALNAGKPGLTLRLLDEHGARFPASQLGDAREVTRMLALCRSGQPAAARERAARFIARRPGSPFLERVRSICAPQ